MIFDDELQQRIDATIAPSADAAQPDDHAIAPMPIKGATPFHHQVKAYNGAISHFYANPTSDYADGGRGYALLHEQGCGKSLTSIAITGRLSMDHRIRRVLIHAPVSVVPVWGKEFAEYAAFSHTVLTPEGTGEEKAKQIRSFTNSAAAGLKVLVVNYESAWRSPVCDALREFDADLIIDDESQRIKNPTAKQSKMQHELGARAQYRLILSGTPVMNSPIDLWSQYRFLDPTIFDASFFAFRSRYAIMGTLPTKGSRAPQYIVAYRNLDELTAKAHSIASRVTKAQALDLPETVDCVRYCQLEPEAQRIYRQLQRESAAELADAKVITAQQIITKLLRLSQITGGFVGADGIDGSRATEAVSTAKLKCLEDVLEDLLAAGKKAVIFARFRAEIEAIHDLCIRLAGADAVRMIWGDTPMVVRGEFVRVFQTDPTVRIFIAQIATAGLGITLTAADTAIYYSCDYSYGNHEQSRARIHRIGQRNACTYIYLVAQGTIDEDVLQALKAKRNLADLCVDNWQTLLKNNAA